MAEVIEVRAATVDDFDAVYTMICELENEAFNEKELNLIYRENLKNDSILYWIAEMGGQSVDFLSLHIQNLLHHAGPAAEIQELFVRSDQRGNGIGTRLVEHARAEAIKRGCKVFEVTTNIKREATHRFYERCGFTRTHYKFTDPL